MIQRDGKHNDRPGHDFLHPVRQPVLRAADLDERHDAGARNGSDDGALAARKAAAADDDGRDDAKLCANRDCRIADRQARELHHARKPRERAGNRIHRDLAPLDADAAQPRRALVRADGEQVAAEARVLQRDRDQNSEQDDDPDPHGSSRPLPSRTVRSMLFSQVIGASSRRSSASPLAPPRTSSMVPSVMMNGTTRRPVMSTPFISPHTAPAAIAPAAATSGHEPSRRNCAVTTVLSAMTDPTDRSIPPATITIVMPSAATHTIAV